jgi:ribose/xylose/arabinose/galactoside ABC-type transport system permease subunit
VPSARANAGAVPRLPTNRYKLLAFVVSATLTGLAGMLLLFNNRMTSADPISVAFSGELLAMVVIGGMRSFSRLGALLRISDYLPRSRNSCCGSGCCVAII